MGGRSRRWGRRDRSSSSVSDEEKGTSHFQSAHHDASPYVSFFCLGGGCDGCRNGLRTDELENGFPSLGRCGTWNLWSANLLRLGPAGIAEGSVKMREKTAKMEMATRMR